MTQVQSPEFGQFTNTAAAAKGTQMPSVTSAESQTHELMFGFFLKNELLPFKFSILISYNELNFKYLCTDLFLVKSLYSSYYCFILILNYYCVWCVSEYTGMCVLWSVCGIQSTIFRNRFSLRCVEERPPLFPLVCVPQDS